MQTVEQSGSDSRSVKVTAVTTAVGLTSQVIKGGKAAGFSVAEEAAGQSKRVAGAGMG